MPALSAAELVALRVARPTRSAAVAGPSTVPANGQRSSDRRMSNGSNGTSASTSTSTRSEGGSSDTCPICAQLAYKKHRKTGDMWVECEQCNTWYHWACATVNPLDSLDNIDKWYCPACINAADGKLKTTYKSAQRRSTRTQGTKLDYANLDAHLPADVSKWMKVIATRDIKEGAFREMKADELTDEWLFGDEGMREPFWIREPDGLEMRMPNRSISIKDIAQVVGPDRPLEVIDVASQSSLAHWTLGQWAQYYEDADRDKVRNVISLEVSNTKLGEQIVAPKLVRKLDWVDTMWPSDEKEPGTYPAVQKYCLMSVKQCWTDWHVDFAGSSVFYHVIRGGKVFYFIRPTPENLKAYETWSGSADKQENEWLGDSVDCVYKIELKPGNTMIIPTGWIHSVYTPSDSLVFGGNFLHSLNISTQLRIYEIELATKVPRKFRFPYFVRLLWMVAEHYSRKLARVDKSKELPLELSDRVMDGLRRLSSFLWEQSTRLPKDANFRTRVFQAMDLPLDGKCFPGYVDESLAAPKEEPATRSVRARLSPTVRKNSPASNGRRTAKETTPVPVAGVKIAATKRDEGDIISRSIVPLVEPPVIEKRVDPKDEAGGERDAEVRKTKSTTTVVRRLVQDDGSVVLETRTVATTVERVKWIEPSPAPTVHAESTDQGESMPTIKAEAEDAVMTPVTSTSLPPTGASAQAQWLSPADPAPFDSDAPLATKPAVENGTNAMRNAENAVRVTEGTKPNGTVANGLPLPDDWTKMTFGAPVPESSTPAGAGAVAFDSNELLSSISASLPPLEDPIAAPAQHLPLPEVLDSLPPVPLGLMAQFGMPMDESAPDTMTMPIPLLDSAPNKRLNGTEDVATKRPRLDDHTKNGTVSVNGVHNGVGAQ